MKTIVSKFTDAYGTKYERHTHNRAVRRPSRFKPVISSDFAPSTIIRTGPRAVDIKRSERLLRKGSKLN
jgi:hypothetical protein